MWNIPEFCKDFKIPFRIARSWVQIETCPYCGNVNYKAAFSITNGTFNCWSCRKAEDFEAVSALLLCTEMEAKEIIWGYRGAVDKRLYRASESRKNAVSVDMPGEELLPVHRRYIEQRNFDPDEIIREWGILGTGPCPDAPYETWKFRIVIPIYLNGRLVSFQARDVTGKSDIRYMGATIEQSTTHYKNLLYGQEFCDSRIVGLTEGVFDLYRMGKGFVCGFGTSLTHAQLYLLAKYHEKIFILFDPDDPNASKKAEKYCIALRLMGRDAITVKWDGTDPGGMKPADARYMRKYLGFPR